MNLLETDEFKEVFRRDKNDSIYLDYLKVLVKCWSELSTKDRLLVVNMIKWKTEEKRNLTDAQRSAITGLYLRKVS